MPRIYPVVEIDNRSYLRPPLFLAPPAPKKGVQSRSNSSSPELVSANKIASSSTSSVNGLTHKPAISSGGIFVDLVVPPNGQFSSQKRRNVNKLGASVQQAARAKNEHELVVPPVDEPCLASIFDDDNGGPCKWSPTHRIARNVEAVTCQWITSDEGFGAIERCEKIFNTTESLAKHVQFAHCDGPRTAPAPLLHLLPCAWGSCKFKRYTPDRLREHVLEHLRPLAYSCPFRQCRMSINSHSKSAEDLELHIQTYHTNDEILLPLGIPKPIKPPTDTLPALLPRAIPQWMVNNPPVGVPREARRPPPSPSPEPEEGVIRPWDQMWLEMNKVEPPAIPLPLGDLTPQQRAENAPVIDLHSMPAAISLPLQPSRSPSAGSIAIDLPAADRSTSFVDLTAMDLNDCPPTAPRYPQIVDMTAASLAKRQAKREYLDGLRAARAESQSPSISPTVRAQASDESVSSNARDSVERAKKRVKVEL